jgi:ribosome-associated translation inhibitor RaiA
MQTPLQLTFRSMPHSASLEEQIRARSAKLDELSDRIISCHVAVSLEGHHHGHGDRHHLSINVGLPGHEILVSHHLSAEHAPESVETTTEHAFDEVDRQLEDWVGRQRAQRHDAAHRPGERAS